MELYISKAPLTLSTPDSISKDIAFLLEIGFTGEQVFFSVNYLSKRRPYELAKSVRSVYERWEEIEPYYEVAKAKKARETLKESEKQYDEKNHNQGAYTPSWFGKSFDKHLFE